MLGIMYECPHCHQRTKQVKAGLNRCGSQRVKCQHCQKRYTPEPGLNGYDVALRRRAIQMTVDGLNQRRIARLLGVSQGSVSNWVQAYAAQLPDEPAKPDTPVSTAEQDELFTFVGHKKTPSTS
jgi:transposase-like protein